ncbi:unnamed protein product [Trichobilharzia szidati]|nr:unnamed protein product [Trichobilharzia szidati]
MDKEMYRFVIDTVITAIHAYDNDHKKMKVFIKEKLDQKYPPNWQCIIDYNLNSLPPEPAEYLILFRCQDIDYFIFKTNQM